MRSEQRCTEELIEWIEKYSGESQDGKLMEWLKDGRVLCSLANGLSESTEIRVRSKKQHSMFHALESVSSFLRWCINTAEIQKYNCFTAPELLENQNEEMVVKTLYELKRIYDMKRGLVIPQVVPVVEEEEETSQPKVSKVREFLAAKRVAAPEEDETAVISPKNTPAKLDKSLFSAFSKNETSVDVPDATVLSPDKTPKQGNKLNKSMFSAFTSNKKEDTEILEASKSSATGGGGGIASRLMSYVSNASSSKDIVQEESSTTPSESLVDSGEKMIKTPPIVTKTGSKLSAFMTSSTSSPRSPPAQGLSGSPLTTVADLPGSPLNAFISKMQSPNMVGSPVTTDPVSPPIEKKEHKPTTRPHLVPDTKPASPLNAFMTKEERTRPHLVPDTTPASPLNAFMSKEERTSPVVHSDSPSNVSGVSRLSAFLQKVPSRAPVESNDDEDQSTENRLNAFMAYDDAIGNEEEEEEEEDCVESPRESTLEVVLTPSPRTLQERRMTYSEEDEAASDAKAAENRSFMRPSEDDGARNANISEMDITSVRNEIDELKEAATKQADTIDSHVNELSEQLASVTAEQVQLEKATEQAQREIDRSDEESDLKQKLKEEQEARHALQVELQNATMRLEESLAKAARQKEEDTAMVNSRLVELEQALKEHEDEELKTQKELELERSRVVQLEKEAQESKENKEEQMAALRKQIESLQVKYSEIEKVASKADEALAEKEAEIQLAKDREEAARYSAQQAFAARELAQEQAQRQDSLIEKLTDDTVDGDAKVAAMLDAKVKLAMIEKEKEIREEMERELEAREKLFRDNLAK